ncbi:unnamed protein product, partial [Polarella glacialis]
ETIRLAQFGIAKRDYGGDGSGCSTMSMEQEVYRNERALPSMQLSMEHLRIRCGGAGMAAQGEVDVLEAKRWLKKVTHK